MYTLKSQRFTTHPCRILLSVLNDSFSPPKTPFTAEWAKLLSYILLIPFNSLQSTSYIFSQCLLALPYISSKWIKPTYTYTLSFFLSFSLSLSLSSLTPPPTDQSKEESVLRYGVVEWGFSRGEPFSNPTYIYPLKRFPPTLLLPPTPKQA